MRRKTLQSENEQNLCKINEHPSMLGNTRSSIHPLQNSPLYPNKERKRKKEKHYVPAAKFFRMGRS